MCALVYRCFHVYMHAHVDARGQSQVSFLRSRPLYYLLTYLLICDKTFLLDRRLIVFRLGSMSGQ